MSNQSFNNSYMNYSSTTPKTPKTGMMFYNTDLGTVQVYDGSQWLTLTDDLIVTADILWSAVLRVEAEQEEKRQEELRKEKTALALVV